MKTENKYIGAKFSYNQQYTRFVTRRWNGGHYRTRYYDSSTMSVASFDRCKNLVAENVSDTMIQTFGIYIYAQL